MNWQKCVWISDKFKIEIKELLKRSTSFQGYHFSIKISLMQMINVFFIGGNLFIFQFVNIFPRTWNSQGRCVIPWQIFAKSEKHAFSCRKIYCI